MTMAPKLVNNEMGNDIAGNLWPIKLKAPIPATLGELKEKISKEYDIPKDTQNWIVGKKLVNDKDKITMEKIDDDSIYLFLSAPIIQINDDDDNKSVMVKVEKDKEMIQDTDDENVGYYDVDSSSDTESDGIEIVEVSDKNEDEILPNNPITKKAKIHEETTTENMKLNQDDEVEITEEIQVPKEYDELMMLDGCDTVPNVDDITCPICLDVFGPAEAVVLQDCLHTFCWVCLQNTIKHCELPVVRCPFVDDNSACESNLREREIKALVSPEIYEKHLSRSVTLAESRAGKSAFHCQTPNCTNWCFIEEEDENFPCSVCNKTNCLKCRVMHDGMNCYQYQEKLRMSKETNGESKKTEAMIEEMLAKRKVMACPTCSVLLTKISGCDSITCGICRTLLCWPTRGPRWGPRGHGDTSGGCRCTLRKRCHPECGGCH